MKNPFKKKNVSAHFQTRHTEAAIVLDGVRVLNVAHDEAREVVIFIFGNTVQEYYLDDAVKHLRNLSQGFENAAKHIEG